MLMALIALIGVFVSLYLTLYKLGYVGTLACGTGSCEKVQLSKWGDFLGQPVAAWGVGYYLLVFAVAVAGVQERFAGLPRLTTTLLSVTGAGLPRALRDPRALSVVPRLGGDDRRVVWARGVGLAR